MPAPLAWWRTMPCQRCGTAGAACPRSCLLPWQQQACSALLPAAPSRAVAATSSAASVRAVAKGVPGERHVEVLPGLQLEAAGCREQPCGFSQRRAGTVTMKAVAVPTAECRGSVEQLQWSSGRPVAGRARARGRSGRPDRPHASTRLLRAMRHQRPLLNPTAMAYSASLHRQRAVVCSAHLVGPDLKLHRCRGVEAAAVEEGRVLCPYALLVLVHVKRDAVVAWCHPARSWQQVAHAAISVGVALRHQLPGGAAAARRGAAEANAHAGRGAAQTRVQHVGGDGRPRGRGRRRCCGEAGGGSEGEAGVGRGCTRAGKSTPGAAQTAGWPHFSIPQW